MIVVGIDPGQSGAIAILYDADMAPLLMPMPLKNDGTKEVSFSAFHTILKGLLADFASHIFLERAMPMAMGAKHAFNYGRGFAALEIAIQVTGLPVTYVEPSKWTKVICDGIDSRLKPKERSLIALQRLRPDLYSVVPKNKNGKLHDGIVESILIAEYGKRLL